MAIPKYDDLFLPFLQFLGDGKEHPIKEVIEHLCTRFKLTDEERSRLLPSGKQLVVNNRVGWARTFLKKAAMLEYVRRGVTQITPRGTEFLSTNPTSLRVKDFKKYSDYDAAWATGGRSKSNGESGDDEDKDTETLTPEERIDEAYDELTKALSASILEQVSQMSPAFFERLVVDLLLKMGYGGTLRDAGKAIGKSGDGGIDGIIKEDKLGLDVIYIQAKRWQNTVSRPEIQKFMGALAGNRAKKGVFITTSDFTGEAQAYADGIDVKIVLIDGDQLASLMIEHNVGVTPQTSYVLKRLDADYFTEEE